MPVSRETSAGPVAGHPLLGVYVHWPFCLSKCPYCDFNSHTARRGTDEDWLAAYVAEIDRHAEELGPRPVASVYFGGGTPSLMQPGIVGGVLDRIARRFRLAADIEITLEANPGAVDAGRFSGYRAAGVNRLSVGAQALEDGALRRLGRLHDVREALHAIELAQATFPRASFDLIYARQNQTAAAWEKELARALALGTGHLSLYQLTIEPGTPFAARKARGRLRGLPEDDDAATMFEMTQAMCGAAGLPAYEVSNHARKSEESRHNGLYWSCADWIGIGPGAHGRLSVDGSRWATESPRLPGEWLEAALGGGQAATRGRLSPDDQAVEYLLMGMRRSAGISTSRLSGLLGRPVSAVAWAELAELGLVATAGDRLAATERGRLLLNSVIAQIVNSLGL